MHWSILKSIPEKRPGTQVFPGGMIIFSVLAFVVSRLSVISTRNIRHAVHKKIIIFILQLQKRLPAPIVDKPNRLCLSCVIGGGMALLK